MKFGSRLLKSIFACTLVLGLMPTLSFAEESVWDTTANTNSTAEEPVRFFAAEDSAEDAAEVAPIERHEGGIQLFGGVQDDVQILEEGDFGEDNTLHWIYRDDASLTISGTGAIPDYAEEGGQPWNAYLRVMEALTIEDGVTAIGAYSFYECDFLGKGEISLPPSLLSIGAYAFANCDYFTEIELQGNLESIGEYAFSACAKLEHMIIPDSVDEIGAHAFERSPCLAECHLPSSLTIIEDYLFYSCEKLSKVNIPDGVTEVKSYAFTYSGAKESLAFPSSLTAIGAWAFGSVKVSESVFIPASIATVGTNAFSFFKVLGVLSFGEGISPSVFSAVASVGGDTSEAWTAYTVVFPASLNSGLYWSSAFARDSYEVKEGNQYYVAVDGVLYSSGGRYDSSLAVLQSCPFSLSGELNIPEGVKEVPTNSIPRAVTKVNLPATLEVFSTSAYDRYAKMQCIEVADGNQVYGSKDGVLFTSDFKKLIIRPPYCSVNNDYVVPSTVETIEAGAFSHNLYLRSVAFPEGLVEIPNSCIFDCNSLISIYIPSSVTLVSNGNFYYYLPSGRLGRNVFYGGSEDEWAAVSKGSINNDSLAQARLYFNIDWSSVCDDGLLCYIDHDRTLNIAIDERATEPRTTMMDYGAGEAVWCSVKDRFDSVSILQAVTSVGANAFNGCDNVQSAAIYWDVNKVGTAAFANCTNLQKVDCLGYPFEVVSGDEEGASFDADRVTLGHQDGISGWLDAPSYNESTSKWNGYSLVGGVGVELPVLGSVSVMHNGSPLASMAVNGCTGNFQSWGGTDVSCPLAVFAEDGTDITDKVNISIVSPNRVQPLTDDSLSFAGNVFINLNRMKSMDVSYDPVKRELKIGRCSPAGTHKVIITPKEFEASGEAIEYPIVVTRAKERYFDCRVVSPVATSGSGMAGRYKQSDEPYVATYEICNQYMESVTSRVEATVIDSLSNEDVTSCLSERGISFPSESVGKIEIDKMAQPRDYVLKFSDTAQEITGSISPTLKLARDSKYLEVPFGVELSNGSDEIEVEAGADGAWSSTPYRVKVFDAFDDPCWPSLGWSIKDERGADVTSSFKVDDQGYVFVSAAIIGRLGANGVATFDVESSAKGWNNSQRQSNAKQFTLKVKEPDPEPVTHTATFKVGDEVMGEVTFAEGDASLETPAMPPKANYIGSWKLENGTAWDDFDLSTATSDLVVEGEYTPLDPNKVSDITTGGDAKYEDGAITVNLKASASSRNVRVESSSTKPVDVVLVCDQSGSMTDKLGGGITKQKALIDCANSFATSLFENAKKTGANHRIALVGFAYSDDTSGKSVNTGLLATNSSTIIKTYSKLKNSDYANALMPINMNGNLNGNVSGGIAAIKAEGATAANLGLAMAKNIFSLNPVGPGTQAGERERIVVFLTDGTPTSWSTTSSEYAKVSNTAAAAIAEAKYIKQSQNARIYSIGVDAGANASAGDLYDSKGWKVQGNTTLFDFNRFLHLVSSNYPAASSMSNKGDGSKDGGYYMPVTNTGVLDSIFTTILYTSVYEIQTFERATIRYEVPSGLALTLKQEEEMRANLEAQGIASDDIQVTRDGAKTVITFSNVPVKQVRNNGVPEYVAQVSFKLSANAGVSGSVSMGSADLDCMGDESTCPVANVTVPTDRCAVVFMLDGQPYEIRDLKEGDAIELPDTDLARWMALEKLTDDQRVAHGTTVVFETTSLSRTYALRWVVNGDEKVENLAPGAKVEVPDVASWIPEGYELAGWVPAPPLSMPSEALTCTAVLTKSHEHAFTASAYVTGYCTDGMVVHEVCACGEEQTHQEEAKSGHAFSTVLSSDGSYANSTKKLVCKECGYSVEKDMEYAAAADDDSVVVLDLTKLESDVAKPGESADDIEIQYFMDAEDGEEYTVTRIDEDDMRTEYTSSVRDGYLWFYPNHFSIYVVGSKGEGGHSTAENVNYANSLERLQRAAAEVPVVTDPPDEDPDVSGDNSGNAGNGSNPGDNVGGSAGNDGSGSGGMAGNGNGAGSGVTANDNGITSGTVPIEGAQRNNTNVGSVSSEGAPLAQTGDKMLPWVVGGGSIAIMALTAAELIYIRRRRDRAA